MFSKYKKPSPLKLKIEYSLEYLKYLYSILLNNQNVTSENKDLLIETLRSISELLIWGDKNDPSLFDFFLEKNMLLFFLSFAKQDETNGKNLSVQILQTLNILFENIKSDTSLYYLLSNNHINSLIQHEFDFSQEEVVAYYITFLKTLSMKLNQHTIHFFINEHSNEFPLYSAAIKFCKSSEPMVRIAVQTITLNIFSVNDKNSEQQISKYSTSYFYDISSCLESNILAINSTLVALNEMILTIVLNEILDEQQFSKKDTLNKFHLSDSSWHHSLKLLDEVPRSPLHSKDILNDLDNMNNLKDKLNNITGSLKHKCIPLLKRLEDLIIDHLDKLHYILDIFKCSSSLSSHLSSLLSEILVNNVFVPCYLKPLSQNNTAVVQDSTDNSQDNSVNLSFDTALFLINVCLLTFSQPQLTLTHYILEKSGFNNPILQELIDLLFVNSNPYQIIMYCCDVRKPFKSSETSKSTPISHTSLMNSFLDDKKTDFPPVTTPHHHRNQQATSSSLTRLSSPPSLLPLRGTRRADSSTRNKDGKLDTNKMKTQLDIVDTVMYDKIKPDDTFSINYMMNSSSSSYYRPQSLNLSYLNIADSNKNTTNPLFNNILSNLTLNSQASQTNPDLDIFFNDGRILILLLFLNTVLTAPVISDSFCQSSHSHILHEVKGKDKRDIPDNIKKILSLLIALLSYKSQLNNKYTNRLITCNLILHLCFTIFSRFLITVDLNAYLLLAMNSNNNTSSTTTAGNESNIISINSNNNKDITRNIYSLTQGKNDRGVDSNVNYLLDLLTVSFKQILGVYKLTLSTIAHFYELDEELFIDTFENELKYFVQPFTYEQASPPSSTLIISSTNNNNTNINNNDSISYNSGPGNIKNMPSGFNSRDHISPSPPPPLTDSGIYCFHRHFDYDALSQSPALLIDSLGRRDASNLFHTGHRIVPVSPPTSADGDNYLSAVGTGGVPPTTAATPSITAAPHNLYTYLAYVYNVLLVRSDLIREANKYVKQQSGTTSSPTYQGSGYMPCSHLAETSSSSSSTMTSMTKNPVKNAENIVAHYVRYEFVNPNWKSSTPSPTTATSSSDIDSNKLMGTTGDDPSLLNTSPTAIMDQDIAMFLMLRQFLHRVSSLFYPLHSRLTEEKLNYQKCMRDYLTTCSLPPLNTVLDLSDKDIISCSLEKHMNQNLPYWFLVVSDFYFSLVIPHQKKMAHGVVMYIAPLKDIEVAHVYNEPRSLYVRTRNSLSHRASILLRESPDNNDTDLLQQTKVAAATSSSNTSSSFSTNPITHQINHSHDITRAICDPQPTFKAKLIFEDTIRCQAAKNCLLKGRARCRKIKCKIMHKLIHSAQLLYLPLPPRFLNDVEGVNCNHVPPNTGAGNFAPGEKPAGFTTFNTLVNDEGPEITEAITTDLSRCIKNPFILTPESSSYFGSFKRPTPTTPKAANYTSLTICSTSSSVPDQFQNVATPKTVTSTSNRTKKLPPVENIPLTHQYLTSPPSCSSNSAILKHSSQR